MDDRDRQDVTATRFCADCGDAFAITVGERRFFEEKQLLLPKRCKRCRQARRHVAQERARTQYGGV